MVPRRGFEPRSARPKHAVLPLDERGMAGALGVEPTGHGFGDRAAPTRSHPLASPAGLEPATSTFGMWRAIRLRHGENVGQAGLPPASSASRGGALRFPRLFAQWPRTERTPLRTDSELLTDLENWSGWKVSNLRSPDPKSGALPTKLHPETVQPRMSFTVARVARRSVVVAGRSCET